MFYGVNNMISIEEYKQNPCKAEHWKSGKQINTAL